MTPHLLAAATAPEQLPYHVLVPFLVLLIVGLIWSLRVGGASQFPRLQEDDLTARCIGLYTISMAALLGGYANWRTVSEVCAREPKLFFVNGQVALTSMFTIIGLTFILAGSASTTVIRIGNWAHTPLQWIYSILVAVLSFGAEFAFREYLRQQGYAF